MPDQERWDTADRHCLLNNPSSALGRGFLCFLDLALDIYVLKLFVEKRGMTWKNEEGERGEGALGNLTHRLTVSESPIMQRCRFGRVIATVS